MQRIMIIGSCGAGKSTLARKLHEVSGIELIHLDQHFWKPHWVETDKTEWKQIVSDLVQRPAWIMDGNYGGTMVIRMQRADTIILLDYPTWLCLFRVIRRVLMNSGKSRQDMPADYPEHFSWDFLKYVYNFRKHKHPQIYERIKNHGQHARVFILQNDREAQRFVEKLRI